MNLKEHLTNYNNGYVALFLYFIAFSLQILICKNRLLIQIFKINFPILQNLKKTKTENVSFKTCKTNLNIFIKSL